MSVNSIFLIFHKSRNFKRNVILLKCHQTISSGENNGNRNNKGYFQNSIHTSNPCGLPRLSLICFHATRISDTDTLVALTSVGAAVGSVWRKMEIINHKGNKLCLPNHCTWTWQVLLPSPWFLNEGLWWLWKTQQDKDDLFGFLRGHVSSVPYQWQINLGR